MPIPDSVKEAAAGWISGVTGTAISHPMDTVKVRLQMDGKRYPNAMNCAVQMVKGEGPRSLFKGLTPPLMVQGVIGSMVFSIHGDMIRRLGSERPWAHFVAGATAGWVQCIVATPTELVKVRLQSAGSGVAGALAQTTTVGATRHILRTQGIRGLYHGNVATMARETAFGVYFATYNGVKTAVSGLLPPQPAAAAVAARSVPTGSEERVDLAAPADGDTDPLWVSSLAGGLAGSMCWATIYPLDVVKSRIQAGTLKTTNPFAAIVQVYRAEGFAPFRRGLGVTMLRSAPNNAVVFSVYELSRRWFGGF